MAQDGGETVWENFDLFESHTVPFAKHAEPTQYFIDALKTQTNFEGPYESRTEIFNKSLELVDLLPTSTNVLLNAWEELIGACLRDEDELDKIDQNKVIKHALRLATTCPSIFGDCLSLVQADRRAVFTLRPLPTVYGIDQELSHQRHDVVQWIVCHDLLGKAFDSDEWVSVVAESSCSTN